MFKELLGIKGSLAVGLGNWRTIACLAFDGHNTPTFPNSKVEVADDYNAEVIQAIARAAKALGFNDSIQQISIILDTQLHDIQVLSSDGYFAVDRTSSNPATANLKLSQLDNKFSFL